MGGQGTRGVRLSSDAGRRGERLQTLVRVTHQVAAGRPLDELVTLVAEEARRVTGAIAAVLRIMEGDELAVTALAGEDRVVAGRERLTIGQGLEGRVAGSGAPLRIADLAEEPGPSGLGPAPSVVADIHSYLGVPLLARDRVCGTLAVWAVNPNWFTDGDVTLLSGLAGQATIAVEHDRLIQQLLHAERLSMVGEIVAGVAHELNNPLAAVIGTADIVRRDPLDPKLAERLARISGQAQRAGKVVRALLTLARKTPVQRTEVAVNTLLEDVLEVGAFELRRGHIAIVRELSPDLPPALADPVQLQQVFINLCVNASEAMWEAHGGGVLTVSTRRDPRRHRIVVTVADDGPGIPSTHLPRIFEPFVTTKGRGKGTGLGLAICRRIVEDHGGRIRVASRPEAGTAFTVELPEGPAGPGKPAAPPRAEASAVRGARVLLIEDEVVVADLLAEFLDVEGHQVDRAASGREALARVRAQPYDLIVTDIRMPDGDGPTFYRELAAIEPALARRVVFVTGDVVSPETRQFLDETGLGYLEKPFDLSEFQAFVRHALAGGSKGGSGTSIGTPSMAE